jgi:hypothetical protein
MTGMNAMTSTYNLFAETVAERIDQVILIGAHPIRHELWQKKVFT